MTAPQAGVSPFPLGKGAGGLGQIVVTGATGFVGFHVAQQLAEQPCGITAGTFAFFQGFFGRLNAGLQTNNIADVFPDFPIEGDEKIDGART